MANMNEFSTDAEAALLDRLNTEAPSEQRETVDRHLWWFVKGVGGMLAMKIIAEILPVIALIVLLAWMVKGSLAAMVPAWLVALFGLGMLAVTVDVVVRWSVYLTGRLFYRERWKIAEAWWRSDYSIGARVGIKAAAAWAVLWAFISVVSDMPIALFPKTWTAIGLAELLILGISLRIARSLRGFLRAHNQEMAIAVMEQDLAYFRRLHHEQLGASAEASPASS